MKLCDHPKHYKTAVLCSLCRSEYERSRWAEKAERERFIRDMIGCVVRRFVELRKNAKEEA